MAEESPSDPPASKPFKLLSQILSARGFILGTAAIITAAASWFKPADTSATKATYEVLASRINELSKDSEANHNDLQAFIRSYLEITKTEAAPPAASAPGPQLPLVTPTAAVSTVRKKKSSPPDYFVRSPEIYPPPPLEDYQISKGGGVEPNPGVAVHADVAQSSEPPTISAREPSYDLPPFDQVVQQASSKKKKD